MERLFNLDFQLLHDTVLLALAVFFLFLALSYLLFNPVRKMLAERQNRIKADIDSAAADKEDAKALKAEYDEKLKLDNINTEIYGYKFKDQYLWKNIDNVIIQKIEEVLIDER